MESQGGVCNVQGHFAPQNLISQKSTGDHHTFYDVYLGEVTFYHSKSEGRQ